jgi:hypothetical protein
MPVLGSATGSKNWYRVAQQRGDKFAHKANTHSLNACSYHGPHQRFDSLSNNPGNRTCVALRSNMQPNPCQERTYRRAKIVVNLTATFLLVSVPLVMLMSMASVKTFANGFLGPINPKFYLNRRRGPTTVVPRQTCRLCASPKSRVCH